MAFWGSVTSRGTSSGPGFQPRKDLTSRGIQYRIVVARGFTRPFPKPEVGRRLARYLPPLSGVSAGGRRPHRCVGHSSPGVSGFVAERHLYAL